MQFDNEQVGQLRQAMRNEIDEALESERFRGVICEVLREEVPVIVTPIVTKIVADAEERIVTRITTSVGEMIEDNVLPQIQELREDIADIREDISEIRGDIAGLRSARWRLA